MKRLWSFVVLSVAVIALSLSVRAARAADDEAAKLAAHGKAVRYTLKATSPASRLDMGGAAILVHAPIATVRKIVTAYGTYQQFLQPFDQSRVLSKRKGVSEVYLQVPILNGAVHIWTVADLSPPTKDGSDELITARFKRGNVADFRANWRLRAVDENRTVLKLELLVDPKLPFPASLVTEQLVRAADKGVTAVRDRAQANAPARAAAIAAAPTSSTPGTPNERAAPPSEPRRATSSDVNGNAQEDTGERAAQPEAARADVPTEPSGSGGRQKDVARR